MIKDASDRGWEWVEKPPESTLTIPAHFHDACNYRPNKRERTAVNQVVRLADPDAHR